MHQTQRNLVEKSQQYDYLQNKTVQTEPGFFSKFLFFNRLAMLYQYISKISKQTLFRYNDSFQPMISTNRILVKFSKSKRRHTLFSIASEIFRMEQRTMITLIILSIIAGLTSLVPIYFQFILVKAVMGNTGNYYSLAVIVCVMFFRFILLNYVLNLSSNIALNIKIYMQNSFMRAVFACNNFSSSAKYLDVDLVGEAFYYIPYLITSQIIIIGDIVFVFLQVGAYGCIVMGIYIILYIAIVICGKLAFNILRQNSQHRQERQKFEKKSFSGLIRTALERVHEYVFRLLVVQRTLQTRQTLKINILYILAQTFGQCCVVLSNITLYALTNKQGVQYTLSYYSVLFMVACFYPMRYSVYGMFTIVKAYEAFLRIDEAFANVHTSNLLTLQQSDHQVHIFAENVGDCFEYTYNQMENNEEGERRQLQRKNTQIMNQNNEQDMLEIKSLRSLKESEVLMVLSRVDSRPTCFQYLTELIKGKEYNKSLIMISTSHFLLPISLKDNILFYSPYNQQRFNKVLQITQLNILPDQMWQQANILDQKTLKYNQWHQSRIQLARALYNNVDYLILNKQNLFDDLGLLTAVFADRKANKKITIIANNTHKYYFKLADRILVIGKRGQRQIGTYNELRIRKQSIFNQMFLRHHQKVDQSARIIEERKSSVSGGALHINHKILKETHLQKSTFFEFFNLIHRKAQFIVIICVFLPPCFKYYLQYLIGTSVKQDIFWRYLIFGLIYILFIFLRGFTLTFYTNFSSLSLYRKICRKLKRLNAHQIYQFYQKPHVDFNFHSRIVDRNLVMDFEYGQSVLVEIIVSFVIYCTGQPAYIAVAIPIIIGIVFVNGQYMKHARMIYLLKLKQTKGINRFIQTAVDRCQSIGASLKADDFNNQFHKQNRVQIIYNSNIQWLETGVRTIAELLVWISFVVFLIIMIYTVQNVSLYTSLVSLGCSMFINLMYLNTFYLKAFRQMEISLVSLTICMNFLKEDPNPTPAQLMRVIQPQKVRFIQFVQSIQFRGLSLRYFHNICNKISLKIEQGQRLVLSGNSNSHKQIIFFTLQNRLFDSQQIKGDISINGQVSRQFHIDKLFYLHADPILPFLGTIYQAIHYTKSSIQQSQLDKQIQQFFTVMDLIPVFSSNTQIQHLMIDQKELFEVFRVVIIQQCKILVIINGLDNIDIVSRRKLMKFLLKKKSINILIETTNVREMIELYPKKYRLQKEKLFKQKQSQADEEGRKKIYLKRLDTGKQINSQQQHASSSNKEEKQFDSMLRIQLHKQQSIDAINKK